ncbi:MAG TPA: uracil-DNA glycosylase [Opitutus sp.]|nr:uracil-DNA glycosylase [Opitutus sp.]
MRAALSILTEELRRLKAAGVKSVAVSDESLAGLRRATEKWSRGAPAAVVIAAKRDEGVASPTEPVALAGRKPAPREESAEPAPAPVPAEAAGVIPLPVPFELPAGGKAERMGALRERVLGDAVCRAHVRPGKKVVVGVGSLDAKIMFVGEAPGGEEEVQGEPFVGPAGQLLTKMINAMGLKREEVYIGNIMNWRPEMPVNASGVQYGNRPPTEDEMRYCLPYLRAQIEIVNPELLVALGSTAAQGLLGVGTFKALGEVRGRWREFAGKPLMVTYHPSYILRNQSNRSKRMIWEDLLKVMERAGLPVSEKQHGYFLGK